jgi:hypothetical protein
MRRFDSDPRLQYLWLVLQRVTLVGKATVSESVSKLGHGSTTLPQFAGTPLKLARYSLTRWLGILYDPDHPNEATFHAIPQSQGLLLPGLDQRPSGEPTHKECSELMFMIPVTSRNAGQITGVGILGYPIF